MTCESAEELTESFSDAQIYPRRGGSERCNVGRTDSSSIRIKAVQRVCPVSLIYISRAKHQADMKPRWQQRDRIDLKHYKTKRIALRWRTAEEVVGAIGEETCGSLRCPYHNPLPEHLVEEGATMPLLQAFELPFTYAEAGEAKTALVKVKVCHRCAKKLLFKPGQEERSSRNRSAEREDMLVRSERVEEYGHSSARDSRRHSPERGGGSVRTRSRSPTRDRDRDRSMSTTEKTRPKQDRYDRH